MKKRKEEKGERRREGERNRERERREGKRRKEGEREGEGGERRGREREKGREKGFSPVGAQIKSSLSCRQNKENRSRNKVVNYYTLTFLGKNKT